MPAADRAADRGGIQRLDVSVLQLSLTSDRLSEQQLYDYGLYNLRQQLAPVHGVTFQLPMAPSTGRSWSTSIL